MRIVVAKCSVAYSGRGETELPAATRAVIIKADGAVSIHADINGNKPLNYMGAGNTMQESRRGRQTIWTFTKKHETITVKLHSIVHDIEFSMSSHEPGLTRTGTEKDIQSMLAETPELLGLPSGTIIEREFDTGAGAVDLLTFLNERTIIAIEVKRIAALESVSQINRYVNALRQAYPGYSVKGMLAALEFKDSTLQQAIQYNIETKLIPKSS